MSYEYGYSQGFVVSTSWARTNLTQQRTAASDYAELINQVNLLSAHVHALTPYVGNSGASFTFSAITAPNSNAKRADSTTLMNAMRAIINQVNIFTAGNHQHDATQTTNSPASYFNSWTKATLSGTKVDAQDLLDLRQSLQNLNGHTHYQCLCNCNYSPCYGYCGGHCGSWCNSHCPTT